jgi:hypothetical protein
MKALGGEEVYLLLILDLVTRWEWVVSVTPRPRFTPRERTPGTHCTGGRVGPTAGLDTEARGKILYLWQGSNLVRPIVQSVARHYTDWATRFLLSTGTADMLTLTGLLSWLKAWHVHARGCWYGQEDETVRKLVFWKTALVRWMSGTRTQMDGISLPEDLCYLEGESFWLRAVPVFKLFSGICFKTGKRLSRLQNV